MCILRQALASGVETSESCSEDSAKPLAQESAQRFDHYQVAIHTDGTPVELGRGAMGITFKAFDTVLGNEVALKVIDTRIAAHPEARERFLREARAAARLRHPNVASVFYYGTRKSDGQCFYAMELVEGETLEARLRRSGPLPALHALEVIAQVAGALIALEAHGLVHRDLKPSNLMLLEGPEPMIKVIDFGLAKAIGGGVSVAAIGGTEEAMGHVASGDYEMVGTFNGNPLAMAACRAMLCEVVTPASYERIEALRQRQTTAGRGPTAG